MKTLQVLPVCDTDTLRSLVSGALNNTDTSFYIFDGLRTHLVCLRIWTTPLRNQTVVELDYLNTDISIAPSDTSPFRTYIGRLLPSQAFPSLEITHDKAHVCFNHKEQLPPIDEVHYITQAILMFVCTYAHQ